MTIQDTYTSTVRQAQDTWSGMLESIVDNQQKAFGRPVNPFARMDAGAAIDQMFDFWNKTLEVQRDAVKTLAGVTASVGETVRAQAQAQAQSVGEMVREQTETVTRVAREQLDLVTQAAQAQEQAAQEKAAQEHAATVYEAQTKAELQDELDRRNLPKTGNVDELRARLVEDDHKSV